MKQVKNIIAFIAASISISACILSEGTYSSYDAGTDSSTEEATTEFHSKIIKWDGFGTGLSWWANNLGNDEKSRKLFTSLLFKSEVVNSVQVGTKTYSLPGLGLNLARLDIGATGKLKHKLIKEKDEDRETCGDKTEAYPQDSKDYDDNNPAHPHKFLEGFFRCREVGNNGEYKDTWDFKNRNMGQRQILREASEYLDEVQLVSHGSMWWMKDSSSSAGGTLVEDGEHLLAEYLLGTARKLNSIDKDKRWASKIKSIAPINEPSAHFWTFPAIQEGTTVKIKRQQNLFNAFSGRKEELKKLELTLTGSDENDLNTALEKVEQVLEHDVVGRIQVHSYYGLKPFLTDVLSDEGIDTINVRQQLSATVEKKNKPIWQTEYGDEDGSGIYLARSIIADINYLKASAWFYWQPVEPWTNWGFFNVYYEGAKYDDPKVQRRSIYNINRKHWVMAHFSRYIKRGDSIFTQDSEEAVLTRSKEDKSQYTLVVYQKPGAEKTLELLIPEVTSDTIEIELDETTSRVSQLSKETPHPENKMWQTLDKVNKQKPTLEFSQPGRLRVNLPAGNVDQIFSLRFHIH